MQVLTIADDTTGALEVGAQFAASGVRTSVSLGTSLSRAARVLVIDSHTRRLKASQARARVGRVASAARVASIPYIYKKTDSTLRGHIASEFQALLETFPDRLLLYVPAYPQMGRTVVGGELFVRGVRLAQTAFARDPGSPSREGFIPALLSAGCSAPVLTSRDAGEMMALLRRAEDGSIIVCDGRTEEDLGATAVALARSGRAAIVAGPAGFSGHWIRTLPVQRGAVAHQPAVHRCLVLSGSMNPISLEQVQRAADDGLAAFFLQPHQAAEQHTAPGVATSIAREEWAALATPGISPRGVTSRISATALHILDLQPVDGLVVFGGETVFKVLRAMGVTVVEPCSDLLPGVPLSLIRYRGRVMTLVTKAGGFGEPDALLSIRNRLEEPT